MQALSEAAGEALAARRTTIRADLGDSLSALQDDLLDRYLVAVALLGWMEEQLLSQGVVTAKGRRRALFGAYAAQLDRVVRLALVLGLERRAKPVQSLAEALAAVELPQDDPGAAGAREEPEG